MGPRQAGKTTILRDLSPQLYLNLILPNERQRYESDPMILHREVKALEDGKTTPLIIVDEVQKVPELLNVAQDLIDQKKAQFVFSGSSARKLRRMEEINLIPGRIITLRLDPLL